MNSFRKKIISIITCTSLAVCMLSACGKNESTEIIPTSTVTEAPTPVSENTPTPTTEATPTTEITPTAEVAPTEEITPTTDVSPAPSGEGDTPEENNDTQQDLEQTGTPWTATIYTGNLPDEIPDINDDMYAYFNYDFLMEHQGENISELLAHSGDLTNGVFSVISDSSKTSPELEQLRLFLTQAYDTETLKEQGMSEIIPFIERIQSVNSIEEMNTLLTSEDFPFSPFLTSLIGSVGRNEKNVICLYPNFLFVDGVAIGGTYYVNADTPEGQALIQALSGTGYLGLMADLPFIGVEEGDIRNWYDQLIAFEISYGKYSDYTSKYLQAEYGTFAEEVKRCTLPLNELEELCTSFPIKDILSKDWEVTDSKYCILSFEWLQVLDELWTEENLETIKMMAIAKVLDETRPYRDSSAYNAIAERYGLAKDPMTFAYNACNSNTTFAHLIAHIYVSECLGNDAVDKITGLTHDIVDAYKVLINNTEWLEDNTREKLIDKLDKLVINILAPDSGYYDFSDVKLISGEEGGTLFGSYLLLKKYRQEQDMKLLTASTPVDNAWYAFTPTTVNAFYDPMCNSINILPGYVSSIIYNDTLDYSDLLGTIGVTVAHEISHGFDYLGAQFNGDAEPILIFSDDDLNDFLAICTKIADYYSSIEVEPGINVSGEIVKGEATADLSGVQAVLYLVENNDEIDIDRLIDQYANIYAKVEPEANLMVELTDTHPLAYLRINVNLQMFDMIYDIYGITEDDGMYLAPEDRIVIWK